MECFLLTGCKTGETVSIPRIPMIPSQLLFHFKHIRFSITLRLGMTINKAQGQTLKVSGLDLTTQYFSLLIQILYFIKYGK